MINPQLEHPIWRTRAGRSIKALFVVIGLSVAMSILSAPLEEHHITSPQMAIAGLRCQMGTLEACIAYAAEGGR